MRVAIVLATVVAAALSSGADGCLNESCDDYDYDDDTSSLLQQKVGVSKGIQRAKSHVSCREMVTALSRDGHDLSGLCQAILPVEDCNDAVNALGALPWSDDAVSKVCEWSGATVEQKVSKASVDSLLSRSSSMGKGLSHKTLDSALTSKGDADSKARLVVTKKDTGRPKNSSLLLHPYDLTKIHVLHPDDYDGKTPLPLIVMLHGYSSYPAKYSGLYGLQDRINKDQFIQIMPPGRRDNDNQRSWQAWGDKCGKCGDDKSLGPCCGDRDMDYIKTIIYAATQNFNVDKKRIYVNGHSDGGAMAYRLACDDAQLFAGIMVLAGSPPEDNWKPGYSCKPSQPVSVLHIHGTSDDDSDYDGGMGPQPYKGAMASSQRFAKFDGCKKQDGHLFPPDAAKKHKTGAKEMLHLLEDSFSGDDTEVFHNNKCNNGTEITLWKIFGARHNPHFDRASYEKHSVNWLVRQSKSVSAKIEVRHCVDKPLAWEDKQANRCEDYVQKKWCNSKGGYGVGWKNSQGWFRDHAVNNVKATSACCACGGGTHGLEAPTKEK